MTGADFILQACSKAGIGDCFANPGTTELALVEALETAPDWRAVLCLHEGIVAGAADGYARMARRPAVTLTHLGPSFASTLANLHNARRAGSPVLNLLSDFPQAYLQDDPPLAARTDLLAQFVGSLHRAAPGKLADACQGAIADALAGKIATLVADTELLKESVDAAALTPSLQQGLPKADGARIDDIAGLDASSVLLIIGGHAMNPKGIRNAWKLCDALGWDLWCEPFPARLDLDADLRIPARIPYLPAAARQALAGYEVVVLAGARAPVAFFPEDSYAPLLATSTRLEVLAQPGEDAAEALEFLAEVCAFGGGETSTGDSDEATENYSARAILRALARRCPENAIIVDEGVSAGGTYLQAPSKKPHSYLALTGGALGFSFAAAIGAAVAAPSRPVITITGDGSAMFGMQGLWTQAREGLNITNIVLNNRGYNILQHELLLRTRAGSQAKSSMVAFENPSIDLSGIARSLGLPTQKVDSVESFEAAIARATSESGPSFIEVAL